MTLPIEHPRDLPPTLPRTHQVGWFLVVGTLAAGVHYVAALVAHHVFGVAPEWANPLAFCIAFPVSYVGHRTRSFADTRMRHRESLPRFLSVAVSSFFANQLLLIAALHWLHLPFWFALGAVLVIVAASTFALSRHWAFRA